MVPLVLVYPHDDIFRGVKQESSLLAERKFSENGESMFEQVVFDEEYLILFRQLFFDAQAEVTQALSAYMDYYPPGTYVEEPDFSHERDFELALMMPVGWLWALQKPLQSKVREFLIAYIMWRWCETKLGDEAGAYRVRAEAVRAEIKAMADRRRNVIRRGHYYW